MSFLAKIFALRSGGNSLPLSGRARRAYQRHAGFGLFLLPFGLPRRFTSVSHLGGLPRRFPCPIVRRSNTTIASEICSRSVRRSASILLMSIFPAYLERGVAVTNAFLCRYDPRLPCENSLHLFEQLQSAVFRKDRGDMGGSRSIAGLQKLTIWSSQSPCLSAADGSFGLRLVGA